MPQKHYNFRLNISADQYLRYYQGAASSVQVLSECGNRLRFPASRLRPFLTRSGISGRFRISVDEQQRFIGLEKLC